MKVNSNIRILLSATLIGGVLFAGLFCAFAQGSEQMEDLQSEEVFCERLEEECLTEDLHDFSGWAAICEHEIFYTDRSFGFCTVLTAASFAVGFHDWIMPLRI